MTLFGYIGRKEINTDMGLSKKKKIVIASLVVIVIGVIVTVVLLLTVNVKNDTKGNEQTVSQSKESSLSSAQFIDIVNSQESVKSLSGYTVSAINDQPSTKLFVYDEEKGAFVKVAATTSIGINATQPLNEEALRLVVKVIEDQLQQAGYSKINKPLPTGTVVVYKNNISSCNIQGVTNASTVLVVCADASSYNETLSTTHALLDAWSEKKEFAFLIPTFAYDESKEHGLANLQAV